MQTPSGVVNVPTSDKTTLSTGMVTDLNDTYKILTALDAAQTAGGYVGLDSFSGATDSDKLAAFRTYATAQTYKPTLVIPNRMVSFTQQFTIYSGFRMIGTYGPTDQVRGSSPMPNQVNINIGSNNGWLVQPNGNTFGVYIAGIAFQGNSTSRWMQPNGSAVLWTSVIERCSWNLFKSVMGSTAQQQLVTATTIDGWVNANNGYDQTFNIGGSDSSFGSSPRFLIDSPTGTITGGTSGQNSHVKFSSLSKTNVGSLYITGERVRPMEISGGSGGLTITNSTLEGRNAGAPSYGAIIRGTNAQFSIRDSHLNFGMANTTAQGYGDAGIVHLTGASTNVLIDGCWYDRATGVAESVPFVYITGGRLVIRNIMPVGSWTGKPIVQNAGGTVFADDTVTVI